MAIEVVLLVCTRTVAWKRNCYACQATILVLDSILGVLGLGVLCVLAAMLMLCYGICGGGCVAQTQSLPAQRSGSQWLV